MSAQSWVETTLPPGYAPRLAPGWTPEWMWRANVGKGWSSGGVERWGFATESERNRAAWRHWTATVLRGRGDVRTEQPSGYLDSGGILWLDWEATKDTDYVGSCDQAVRCGTAVVMKWRNGFIVRHHASLYEYVVRDVDDVD